MALLERVLVGFALAAGGCSLLVPLDDLTSRGEMDGATIDAAGDATAEASPTHEASSDAPTVDATACDAGFCDDFDDEPVGARWSRKTIAGDARLEVDPTTSTSAPRSLSFDIPKATNGDTAEATLELELGAVSRLACTFDLRIDSGPDAGAFDWLDILEVAFDGAKASDVKSGRIIAAVSGGNVSIRDDVFFNDGGCGCPRTWPTGLPLTVGAWSHMSFETDFNVATLSVDGTLRVSAPIAPIARGAVRIRFGAKNYRPSAWRVHLDTLRCTSS